MHDFIFNFSFSINLLENLKLSPVFVDSFSKYISLLGTPFSIAILANFSASVSFHNLYVIFPNPPENIILLAYPFKYNLMQYSQH